MGTTSTKGPAYQTPAPRPKSTRHATAQATAAVGPRVRTLANLQRMVDASPQVQAVSSLQRMAEARATVQRHFGPAPAQRLEEDETLQGEALQRAKAPHLTIQRFKYNNEEVTPEMIEAADLETLAAYRAVIDYDWEDTEKFERIEARITELTTPTPAPSVGDGGAAGSEASAPPKISSTTAVAPQDEAAAPTPSTALQVAPPSKAAAPTAPAGSAFCAEMNKLQGTNKLRSVKSKYPHTSFELGVVNQKSKGGATVQVTGIHYSTAAKGTRFNWRNSGGNHFSIRDDLSKFSADGLNHMRKAALIVAKDAKKFGFTIEMP